MPDWSGSMPLHRTRIDRERSAVTYTSTDYVKINECGVNCEITEGELTVARANVGKWLCDWTTMEGIGLETDMRTGFTLQLHPESLLPEFMRRKEGVSVHRSIEVYVAGCRQDGMPAVMARTKPIIDHSERLLRGPNPFNRGPGGRRGRICVVSGTNRRYYVMGRECSKSEYESSAPNLL
ncbi:hypothetical protein EUGRSUZ_J01432 [Eucalyptus grandis]|uniref:Uncharacterized protein n=2 Tax=Eucalyptus grandis TaxID=71139 RepID=A0ACC3J6Q0_EUCGR|nr:hypothetical protein EUGRSUZ_J01432 [Eucalyptus grandis]